jgi:biotin synthase
MVCTTQEYEKKLDTITTAKRTGLKVCCGGIFGLGERWEHRVEMALTLRTLSVDAVPINFLNPVKGTPLGKNLLLSPLEALKIISVYRFLLPDKEIKVCGGREIVLGDLQPLMYLAGADGTMMGNYLTTEGRPAVEDVEMAESLGFTTTRL